MITINTVKKNFVLQTFNSYILKGAGLALLLATVFLLFIFNIGNVMKGKPFWDAAWQLLPIITVTIGGAGGGILFYLFLRLFPTSGRTKTLMLILASLGYMVILWMSLILGFSATGLWN